MKKIVQGYTDITSILDPKDYIIIEKNKQHISDKYVDIDGDKINEYKRKKALKKGDVVIKGFYNIGFWDEHMSVYFEKFKYYDRYRNNYRLTPKLKKGIKSKNSVFDFNHIKKRIVDLFSKEIRILWG